MQLSTQTKFHRDCDWRRAHRRILRQIHELWCYRPSNCITATRRLLIRWPENSSISRRRSYDDCKIAGEVQVPAGSENHAVAAAAAYWIYSETWGLGAFDRLAGAINSASETKPAMRHSRVFCSISLCFITTKDSIHIWITKAPTNMKCKQQNR